MAAPADKKRFADAVVSRFGKSMGPSAPPSDEPDEDDTDSSDKEVAAMFRSALKNGDDKALLESIRRIAG